MFRSKPTDSWEREAQRKQQYQARIVGLHRVLNIPHMEDPKAAEAAIEHHAFAVYHDANNVGPNTTYLFRGALGHAPKGFDPELHVNQLRRYASIFKDESNDSKEAFEAGLHLASSGRSLTDAAKRTDNNPDGSSLIRRAAHGLFWHAGNKFYTAYTGNPAVDSLRHTTPNRIFSRVVGYLGTAVPDASLPNAPKKLQMTGASSPILPVGKIASLSFGKRPIKEELQQYILTPTGWKPLDLPVGRQ